jgi:hypothetical protein
MLMPLDAAGAAPFFPNSLRNILLGGVVELLFDLVSLTWFL